MLNFDATQQNSDRKEFATAQYMKSPSQSAGARIPSLRQALCPSAQWPTRTSLCRSVDTSDSVHSQVSERCVSHSVFARVVVCYVRPVARQFSTWSLSFLATPPAFNTFLCAPGLDLLTPLPRQHFFAPPSLRWSDLWIRWRKRQSYTPHLDHCSCFRRAAHVVAMATRYLETLDNSAAITVYTRCNAIPLSLLRNKRAHLKTRVRVCHSLQQDLTQHGKCVCERAGGVVCVRERWERGGGRE